MLQSKWHGWEREPGWFNPGFIAQILLPSEDEQRVVIDILIQVGIDVKQLSDTGGAFQSSEQWGVHNIRCTANDQSGHPAIFERSYECELIS